MNRSRLALAGCVTIVLALSYAAAETPTPEDELIGLWGYGTSFGPMLQGELVVERTESGWRGRFGGLEATAAVGGAAVRLTFPDGHGVFLGSVADKGRTIEGWWLRRGVTEDPRFPAGASQPFATPLVLERIARDRFRSDVKPPKDRCKLYLKVFRRTEDGMLLGAFRDPYLNRTGGASRFRLTRDGDTIAFSQPNDHDGFDVWFEARLLRDPERIAIRWAELDREREIELERRSPEDKLQFFARPPGEPPYVYRKPETTSDGWKTARGREVGIDEGALESVVRKIIEADPADRRPSLIHSLLIARHGKLVLEEYFFGWDRETPHDLRSAGKTFASVLLGAAMMQGKPISPDTKIYELLAPAGPYANPDPRKATIALSHLMTHTSGLACNDNDEASPGNEGTMQSQKAQPDWWKYTLDLPMAHEPGTRYAYCSANMNLMGAALTEATGTWLPAFFERTIARPLDFGPYHWNLMPNDEGYLGGGAWLRPRDLLKVGQAYLDGGVWRGRRIVEESWVSLSTKPYVHISPATTGLSEEEFQNSYGEGDDAWAWHLGELRAGDRVFKTYAATGNGGQILVVAPELDLAVVFTGGNYLQGGIWSRWPAELVGAAIVPSMRD